MRASRVFWPNEKCLIIRLIRRTAAPRRAFPEDQPRLVPRLRRTRRRTPTSRTARAAGDTRTCAAASSRALARAAAVPHAPAARHLRSRAGESRRARQGVRQVVPVGSVAKGPSFSGVTRGAVAVPVQQKTVLRWPEAPPRRRRRRHLRRHRGAGRCRCACAGAPRHRRRRRRQHGGVQPFPAARRRRLVQELGAERSVALDAELSCRRPSSRRRHAVNKRFPRAQSAAPARGPRPAGARRAGPVSPRVWCASRTPGARARGATRRACAASRED